MKYNHISHWLRDKSTDGGEGNGTSTITDDGKSSVSKAPTEDNKLIAELRQQLADANESDDKNYEIRLTKAQGRNRDLTGTIGTLNKRIEELERIASSTEDIELREQGELNKLLEKKDARITALEQNVEDGVLNVDRLLIGRQHGLPDSISKMLPGSTREEIIANAKLVQNDIPEEKPEPERLAYSDANQVTLNRANGGGRQGQQRQRSLNHIKYNY